MGGGEIHHVTNILHEQFVHTFPMFTINNKSLCVMKEDTVFLKVNFSIIRMYPFPWSFFSLLHQCNDVHGKE